MVHPPASARALATKEPTRSQPRAAWGAALGAGSPAGDCGGCGQPTCSNRRVRSAPGGGEVRSSKAERGSCSRAREALVTASKGTGRRMGETPGIDAGLLPSSAFMLEARGGTLRAATPDGLRAAQRELEEQALVRLSGAPSRGEVLQTGLAVAAALALRGDSDAARAAGSKLLLDSADKFPERGSTGLTPALLEHIDRHNARLLSIGQGILRGRTGSSSRVVSVPFGRVSRACAVARVLCPRQVTDSGPAMPFRTTRDPEGAP